MGLSSSAMGMQWKAPIASSVLNMRDFPNLARLASQLPMGWRSLTVARF